MKIALHEYIIAEEAQKTLAENTLLTGQSIGNQIVVGTARIIHDARDINQIQKGDILVTDMTDPDWVPVDETRCRHYYQSWRKNVSCSDCQQRIARAGDYWH